MNMKRIVLFLFLLWILVSCSKENNSQESLSFPQEAILVYMIADNDLDYFAVTNINQMEYAFYQNMNLGKLYVYIDRARHTSKEIPILYEIKADTTPKIVSKIVKQYPEQNASDPEIFYEVLTEVEKLPNVEKIKGLILWSHGSAWLPSSKELISNRITKNGFQGSFGVDKTIGGSNSFSEMNIKELAKKLENKRYQFLLFDACFMASVEVLYELKDSFSYIIASPTEILSSGFPYKEVIPLLFTDEIDYIKIADLFVSHYKKGINPSASISVIDTRELEKFSSLFSLLISENEDKEWNLMELLQYDTENSYWLFDIRQFLLQSRKTPLQKKILKQLDKVIKYYKHTDSFFQKIDLSNSSGLTIYLPNNHTEREKENTFYRTLSWYQASFPKKIKK